MARRPVAPPLDTLVCPACGSGLGQIGDRLRCSGCTRTYPLLDGIPVLMPAEKARGQLARVAPPWLYDVVQQLAGGGAIASRVAQTLNALQPESVLDVGAGTGALAPMVEAVVRYVWLDSDVSRLRTFARKGLGGEAVVADAVHLPFANAAVDYVALVDAAHHLDDAALSGALAEARRVSRSGLVFVDAVRSDRLVARGWWALDRGRHPRTEVELVAAICDVFAEVDVTRFRAVHDHLLVVAR